MSKIAQIILGFVAIGLTAQAAPLSAPTAVHTQPNGNAAVVKVLSAGTEPEVVVLNVMSAAVADWTAIKIPGPFVAYVQNKDIDKGLHVKDGAAIHLQPSLTSGVLTTMEAGDKTSITGLHGKWTQISLDKSVIGYIKSSGTPSAQSSSPTLVDVPAATPKPAKSERLPAPAYNSNSATQTSTINVRSSGSSDLPRLFQGKFVSTRRPFTPRRPYDWQLNDNAGVRYAYLDISKLLLTDQIESFAEHEVVVYGSPKALTDGKNIVIQVENLRLK
jgi:hypothetical protein